LKRGASRLLFSLLIGGAGNDTLQGREDFDGFDIFTGGDGARGSLLVIRLTWTILTILLQTLIETKAIRLKLL
jgi:hypothetical protein